MTVPSCARPDSVHLAGLGLVAACLLGVASAACSSNTGLLSDGLPNTGSGGTGATGSGGTTSTGSGGTTSTGSGGTTVIDVPMGAAGGTQMSMGGAPTGPVGFPPGYTHATIGGLKVGDPITSDAAQ